MNDVHAIDDKRAAQITKRIGETFVFMRDVIDDPSILDEIPDGAEIDLRLVTVGDHAYRIVAYRSESAPGHWIACTMGRTDPDLASECQFWVSVRLASGISAEAALDSVEAALRAAQETDQRGRRIA